MLNPKIIHVQNQFKNLEIHAAKSGRLVLAALLDCIQTSAAENFLSLVNEVKENCKAILEVIPPYAPPLNSINMVLIALENHSQKNLDLEVIRQQISQLIPDSKIGNSHELMVKNFLPLLSPNMTIYTHTLSETILGVLIELKNIIPKFRVIVTESRPNNDGWITVNKLIEAGIDATITIDMCFPSAIDQSHVVFSGTEIINPDGSVVCKIGILPIALYCKRGNKPFYIIADTNKICPIHSKFLGTIPITLNDMGLIDTTDKIKPYGDFFDTTPSDLISGYITEKKLFTVDDIQFHVKQQSVSKWLKQQLNS